MSQHTSLIPVFTGAVQNTEVQMCDARTLHEFLGVGRRFATWITDRIEKYGFDQGYDYVVVENDVFPKSGKNLGGRPQTDYHLTLDMAKELAMVENNEKGREVRRYFIACERELLSQRPFAQLSAPYAVLPGQTISAEQADQLRDMLQEAADKLPEEQRRKFMIQAWSKLKAHFHVEYRKIPSQHFTDALSLAARHIASYGIESEQPEIRRILNTLHPRGLDCVELSATALVIEPRGIADWIANPENRISNKLIARIAQACFSRIAASK